MASLTVVIPVFNEASHIEGTIEALARAAADSGFDTEVVIVDDGSTDGSGHAARAAANGRLPVRVLAQQNLGRFAARRAGLEAANGEYVLFLDARVGIAPGSLRFVHEHLNGGQMWNGHVHVRTRSVLGIFWKLLAELAWRDYFDEPRTTSFGAEDFDRFPKGTTCFLAPRAVLEPAFAEFRSRYRDARLANDDTPILRTLASQGRIGISPEFACDYAPRTTLVGFVRHSFRRGTVFLDGHATPASRFFPLVVVFFPASAALALVSLRRPLALPSAALLTGLGAAGYGARAGRSRREMAALAAVTPIYAAAHAAGMWRGVFELVRNRRRS
jgi:prepilin-type processing-associated H-X9-DG protein